MLTLNKNIVVDRYYRGAVVLVGGKLYMLSEQHIKLVEEVVAKNKNYWGQESEKKLQNLKDIGILVEQ